MSRAAGRVAVLLRLYPAEWRARYGAEFARLLEAEKTSATFLLDVLAGAIDARLYRDYPRERAGGPEPTVRVCDSAAPIGVLVAYGLLWIALTMTLGDRPATNAFEFPGLAALLFVGWSIRTGRVHSHAAKALLMAAALATFWALAAAGYVAAQWLGS
jgi:hypothetical protein